MEEEINLDNLWNDLLDNIAEIESDLKGNRRGLRHLKTLKLTITDVDNLLKNLGKKKGFFK